MCCELLFLLRETEGLTTFQLPTFKVYKKGKLFDEHPSSNSAKLQVCPSIPQTYPLINDWADDA